MVGPPGSKLGWIGITSRWPFDDAPVIAFRAKPLLADFVFILSVLVGTAYTAPLLVEWIKAWRSFSLRTVIIAMTLFSALFAASVPFLKSESTASFAAQCFGKDVPPDAQFRHALQLLSIGTISIGTLMAVFALVHLFYARIIAGRVANEAVTRPAVLK